MTLTNALGVNGLLMSNKLSFVVCAFSKEAESRRTWRGFGGFAGSVASLVEEDKEAKNCAMRCCEDVARSVSALRSLDPMLRAMVGSS